MYNLRNDYSEGAHPAILKLLLETNEEQTAAYGNDKFSREAKDLIRKEVGNETAAVYFIPGGTHTNLTVISALLRSHEAVVTADSGHINVHEAGAIEAVGHKVLSVSDPEGKLTPANVLPVLQEHTNEHMVKPRLLYISNCTEVGTVYSKQELEELHRFCRANSLYLYMDGARIGAALCSRGNDLTMEFIGKHTDAFYIGGTKNGALLGEALVITNDQIGDDFLYHIKQRGAMLAKGRIMGLQFLGLFRDRLFYQLAEHAVSQAIKLKDGIGVLGYRFLTDSGTNIQFPIFPKDVAAALEQEFEFEFQHEVGEAEVCIRLVTSWATSDETIAVFLERLTDIS